MRNHLKSDPDTDRGVLRTVEDAMNATYTPGPWHVGMRPGPIVYGALGEQIADCRDTFQDRSTNGYNARLIAEAPAMAEALHALFEHCSMIHKHWGEGSNQKQADAAIANGRALLARIHGTTDHDA